LFYTLHGKKGTECAVFMLRDYALRMLGEIPSRKKPSALVPGNKEIDNNKTY